MVVLSRKSCKSQEHLNFYRCYSLLLFASSQRQVWLCESSFDLQNLRRDHRSHTLEQQANHLCYSQQFWSTSHAFWWSTLLLVLLSVAFTASFSDFALRSHCFSLNSLRTARSDSLSKTKKTSSTNSDFEEEFWDATSAWTMGLGG